MSASTTQQQYMNGGQVAGAPGGGNGGTRSPTTTMTRSLMNGGSSPRSIASLSSMSSSAAIATASPMQSKAGVPQPTDDELAGRSYLDWLKSWDDFQVARWLSDNRCTSHAATFAANDIRGNVILDVDQSALKEMGVQSVSRLSKTIRTLETPADASARRTRLATGCGSL